MVTVLAFAFLIGLVSGLRAFTGIAAVSWAARLHLLDLGDTKLAFLGYAATPWILTLLALGEFVTDQLPKTPSRTVPAQLAPRVLLGALCGAAIGVSHGVLGAGVIAGVVGALAGTYGGAAARGALARTFGSDRPAALLEDVVAVGLALFAVTHGGVIGV